MEYNELPCTIEDVIRLLGITVVRDTGTNLICKCPFCNDRKGHFDAKLEDNVFHCYRCGKGGGVLHLYAYYHDVSLSTAGKELRSIFESEDGRAIRGNHPSREIIHAPELEIAPVSVRNNTYSNLFSLLTLGDSHRKALNARGMSEEDIEWAGYRTTPAVRLSRIVSELQARGCRLEGVPGFYCDESSGEWKIDIRNHGIMIPDRNCRGEIEAVQIRLDSPYKGHKFNNFTSTDKYYGTAANCCPHFVGVRQGMQKVIVTEGIMKSDIAYRFGERLGQPIGVVGLTGAGMKNQYRRALEELKSFGTLQILLAYDADFRTNDAVAENRKFALDEGAQRGYDMIPLEWSSKYKGIDDLFYSFLKSKAEV